MKKKWLGSILGLCFLAALSACGNKNEGKGDGHEEASEAAQPEQQETKEEYWDYKAGPDGAQSTHSQCRIIAENKELWLKDEEGSTDWYNPLSYQYAVTDLDRNGRLEILSAETLGSGMFTYMRIYEVNETYDGLEACEAVTEERDSGRADVIQESATFYWDAETNEHIYIFSDWMRNGITEAGNTIYAVRLENGSWIQTPLSYYSFEAAETGEETERYMDAAGHAITKEAYENTADALYGHLEKGTVHFKWQSREELLSLDTEEIWKRAEESWDGFTDSLS